MAYNRLPQGGTVALGDVTNTTTDINGVFEGPVGDVSIALFNRGGQLVPNTDINQYVPTQIGAGFPAEWSDFYTASNWNPNSGDPKPPLLTPNPVIKARVIPNPTTTSRQGRVTQVGLDVGDVYTLGSVKYLSDVANITIQNYSQPNALPFTPGNRVGFVVKGFFNYNSKTKADVRIAASSGLGISYLDYFYRNKLDAGVYASISQTSALSGNTVTISGLLNVQDEMLNSDGTLSSILPTVLIGGVPQTVTAVTRDVTTVPNKLLFNVTFTISAQTPTVNSQIIIKNSVGDQDFLSQQSNNTPILFRRVTVVDADRLPPNIAWYGQEIPAGPGQGTLTWTASTSFFNTPSPLVANWIDSGLTTAHPTVNLNTVSTATPGTSVGVNGDIFYTTTYFTYTVTEYGDVSINYTRGAGISSTITIPNQITIGNLGQTLYLMPDSFGVFWGSSKVINGTTYNTCVGLLWGITRNTAGGDDAIFPVFCELPTQNDGSPLPLLFNYYGSPDTYRTYNGQNRDYLSFPSLAALKTSSQYIGPTSGEDAQNFAGKHPNANTLDGCVATINCPYHLNTSIRFILTIAFMNNANNKSSYFETFELSPADVTTKFKYPCFMPGFTYIDQFTNLEALYYCKPYVYDYLPPDPTTSNISIPVAINCISGSGQQNNILDINISAYAANPTFVYLPEVDNAGQVLFYDTASSTTRLGSILPNVRATVPDPYIPSTFNTSFDSVRNTSGDSKLQISGFYPFGYTTNPLFTIGYEQGAVVTTYSPSASSYKVYYNSRIAEIYRLYSADIDGNGNPFYFYCTFRSNTSTLSYASSFLERTTAAPATLANTVGRALGNASYRSATISKTASTWTSSVTFETDVNPNFTWGLAPGATAIPKSNTITLTFSSDYMPGSSGGGTAGYRLNYTGKALGPMWSFGNNALLGTQTFTVDQTKGILKTSAFITNTNGPTITIPEARLVAD